MSVRGAVTNEFFSPKSELSGMLTGTVFKEFQKVGVAGQGIKKVENMKKLEDFTNT